MQVLVDFILKQARSLWPLEVVREWQKAILVRCGIIVRELPPGLHWRWWFVEQVFTVAGTECALDLGTAAITTSDGKQAVLSANLGYVMFDMAKNYQTLWDTEKSLGTLALGHIASHAAKLEFDLLTKSRLQVESELLVSLNLLCNGWGVEIKRVHLTDCVSTRVNRHYLDGMKS